MKYLYVLTGVLMTFASAFIQAEDINFYDYSLGINYQYLSVKDYRVGDATNNLGSGSGHAIGLFYKGEPYDYILFSTGIDYMTVEDSAPFVQTVKNEITGDVSVRKSDVSGFGLYAEGGLMYKPKQIDRLSFGLLGGYRYNNIERAIFQCDACQTEELKDFDSSLYGKAFVEFQLTQDVHLQLNYTHFISDTGFDNSVGIQVSFLSF